MADTSKHEDFYTAGDVAKIKGIKRQSVIEGCKRGQYPGAFKTDPDSVNRQGLWLIPKAVIDSSAATITKDVVTVTRPLSPADLQVIMKQSVKEAVDESMKQFEQNLEARLDARDQLLMETLHAIQEKNQHESKKKPFWKFWKK